MSTEIYKNCPYTQTNAYLYRSYDRQTHPSIDLYAKSAFSPCYGIIIQVCKYEDEAHYSVVLQYNGIVSIRYTNLTNVYVNNGDKVVAGECIGECDGWVGIELLVPMVRPIPYPAFRVTINKNLCLYKSDANILLDGKIRFENPR